MLRGNNSSSRITSFSDGTLEIYEIVNDAEKGDMPTKVLSLKETHYYACESLGVARYYEAMRAGHQVDCVVSIPDWNNDVTSADIIVLDGGLQYQVGMIQKQYDGVGQKITKLTLERNFEEYEIN